MPTTIISTAPVVGMNQSPTVTTSIIWSTVICIIRMAITATITGLFRSSSDHLTLVKHLQVDCNLLN